MKQRDDENGRERRSSNGSDDNEMNPIENNKMKLGSVLDINFTIENSKIIEWILDQQQNYLAPAHLSAKAKELSTEAVKNHDTLYNYKPAKVVQPAIDESLLIDEDPIEESHLRTSKSINMRLDTALLEDNDQHSNAVSEAEHAMNNLMVVDDNQAPLSPGPLNVRNKLRRKSVAPSSGSLQLLDNDKNDNIDRTNVISAQTNQIATEDISSTETPKTPRGIRKSSSMHKSYVAADIAAMIAMDASDEENLKVSSISENKQMHKLRRPSVLEDKILQPSSSEIQKSREFLNFNVLLGQTPSSQTSVDSSKTKHSDKINNAIQESKQKVIETSAERPFQRLRKPSLSNIYMESNDTMTEHNDPRVISPKEEKSFPKISNIEPMIKHPVSNDAKNSDASNFMGRPRTRAKARIVIPTADKIIAPPPNSQPMSNNLNVPEVNMPARRSSINDFKVILYTKAPAIDTPEPTSSSFSSHHRRSVSDFKKVLNTSENRIASQEIGLRNGQESFKVSHPTAKELVESTFNNRKNAPKIPNR